MDTAKQTKHRILIAVPVHNRPHVTRLCLEQLKRYKTSDDRLHVFDDQSSDYDFDRAVNPSSYLSGRRKPTLDYLMRGKRLTISF